MACDKMTRLGSQADRRQGLSFWLKSSEAVGWLVGNALTTQGCRESCKVRLHAKRHMISLEY